MDIDNPDDFVKIDDYGEFIMLNIEKNTSAIRDKYRNDLVFVFTSVFNNFPQTSIVLQILIQINTFINHINKHTIKIYN